MIRIPISLLATAVFGTVIAAQESYDIDDFRKDAVSEGRAKGMSEPEILQAIDVAEEWVMTGAQTRRGYLAHPEERHCRALEALTVKYEWEAVEMETLSQALMRLTRAEAAREAEAAKQCWAKLSATTPSERRPIEAQRHPLPSQRARPLRSGHPLPSRSRCPSAEPCWCACMTPAPGTSRWDDWHCAAGRQLWLSGRVTMEDGMTREVDRVVVVQQGDPVVRFDAPGHGRVKWVTLLAGTMGGCR